MSKHNLTSDLDDGASNAKKNHPSDYHFDAVFTLQHICSVKLATALWSCQRSRVIVKSSYVNSNPVEPSWDRISDKIKEILFSLTLPELFKKTLSRYVKAVGVEVSKWIEYQDVNIFQIYQFSPKAYNFIDYVTWTKRGTVDCEQTARGLFHDATLSRQEKYAIACTYCFKEEVCKIGPSVVHEDDFRKIELYKYPLIIYWTHFVSPPQAYPYIRLLTFEFFERNKMNSSAVKVIGKLKDECLGGDCMRNRSIRSWMKDTDLELQHAVRTSLNIPYRVMHSTLGFILQNYINNFLWEDYFVSAMYYYRNLMGKIPFWTALIALVERIRSSDDETYDKYVGIFKEVWTFAPDHLKMYVMRPQSMNLMNSILLALRWDKHFNIIEMLLADKTEVYKNQLIFSKPIQKTFSRLLERNQFQYMDMLIDLCLTDATEKSFLKRMLVGKLSVNIVLLHFTKNKNLAQLNRVLRWDFDSDVHVRNFKSGNLPSIVRLMTRTVFFNHDATPLEELETDIFQNYLMWHFESKVDQVENFKMRLASEMVYNTITPTVMAATPNAVRNLMKWLFMNNQTEVENFKNEKIRSKIIEFL